MPRITLEISEELSQQLAQVGDASDCDCNLYSGCSSPTYLEERANL